MLAKDKGILARSRPYTYSADQTVNIDMSFLHRFMHGMKAPVVREVALHYNGDISGVTATFDNEDGCMLFNRIRMSDQGGSFYDLPGKLARHDSLIELGEAASEVDGLADAASGATTSGDDLLLRIPFDLPHARNGADFALPLSHLVEGGEIAITFGTPVGSTGASGTLTVYAVVHDEMQRELKSRYVRKHQAINNQDDHYPLNGSQRLLVLTSNPTTAGNSAWTAGTYTALNVPELEYSSQRSYILREEYRRLRRDRASNDPVVAAGEAIPLVIPSSGQRIDKMPDLKSIHIDLGTSTVPTSAELLIGEVQDRHPGLAARWLGFSDEARFLAAIRDRGVVALGGGRSAKATAFNPVHARRMPMKLKSV